MVVEFQDLQKDIVEPSYELPIVVDFWAEWCSPCRVLGPMLEKLALAARGSWRLVKVNVDQHQELAMQLQIQSIPAVKMIYEGQIVAEFVGALPESQILAWLDENLPQPEQGLLESAKEALASGDRRSASKMLKEFIKIEENNYEARALLAAITFENDSDEAATLVESIPEDDANYYMANSIFTLNRLLKSEKELEKQAKQQPEAAKAWEGYLKGIKALRHKNYENALKTWIDVVTFNREIDNDGPRKACVALFHLLGKEHELTQKYHRRFTMVLY